MSGGKWAIWVLALPLVILSCKRLTGSELDIRKTCAVARQTFEGDGDQASLLLLLQEQTGIKPSEIRVEAEGYYIPMKRFFVEESGYLVANPGVEIEVGEEHDPAYLRIEDCVFTYKIKG